VGLYSIISAAVAVAVGLSALTLAAAIRRGARSEESLGVPATVENPRPEPPGPY
jgi:hypothetical protein